MEEFCQNIKGYHELRNKPAEEALSNMSPYLHFGQLSAQAMAVEVSKQKKKHRVCTTTPSRRYPKNSYHCPPPPAAFFAKSLFCVIYMPFSMHFNNLFGVFFVFSACFPSFDNTQEGLANKQTGRMSSSVRVQAERCPDF